MTRRRIFRIALIALAIPSLAVALLAVAPCPPLLEPYGFSRAFVDRDGRLLRLSLAGDERYRVYAPLDRISPLLVQATLLQEDRHFDAHPGFNPVALVRGAWQWATDTGHSGGSTLTMQLARLRFHLKTRTAWGKLGQIARAVQLELHYSKDEILQAYLNLAPYGRNIEGAEAASLIWFGKTADRLTLPEALTLCQIPRHPSRHGDEAAWTDALHAGRDRLFAKWLQQHPADADAAADLALPIALKPPTALPRRASHAVDEAARGLPAAIGPDAAREVRLSLDLAVQELVERHVAAYVAQGKARGIENAAVLLVDLRTGEQVARVGSADYRNAAIHGQVDGVRAPRSPGSALKPFVYALAMDAGLIHPLSLLKDAPLAFRDFNPENFDRDFLGPLRAVDALVHSRNVPAVELGSRLPPSALHDLLAAGHVRRLGSVAHHGLALVLGGVEVSLEELVGMYARLAAPAPTFPVSPESAWLTLWMLRHNPRPGRGWSEASAGRGAEVAWKTGTSAGFHDAWAVGLFGPYVLGVWVGNFDGRPNRAFIGREAAGPLFFDLVDALRARSPDLPELVPERPPDGLNLQEVEVCAASGQIPNESCPHRTRGWFIPGRSPIDVCRLHRTLELDAATGLRACPGATGPVRREVYEMWATDDLESFRRAGVPRRVPPPFPASCNPTDAAAAGLPPRITSPRNGSSYALRVGLPTGNDLPLKAVSESGVRTLHWFIDDQYQGAHPPAEAVLWPLVPGTHTARVVDDRGRPASRRFVVRTEVGR